MLTITRAVACAIVFVVGGCSSIARTGASEAEQRAARELEAEYSVYSHLLRLYRNESHMQISDSTHRALNGNVSFCSEPDRKPGYCVSPRPGTSVEMWTDYARKNRQRWLLLSLFDRDLNI